MSDLILKSEKLLKKCSECSVAAVTTDGFPRVCILKLLKTDGIKKFWFSTGTSSRKTADYQKNSKAGVTFYRGGDSVTFIGRMYIVVDKDEKRALWEEWLAKHFQNGGINDPEYCVIRFEAEQATVYIDGEFETLPL